MYEKDEKDLLPQGEKSSVESVPQDQSSAQTIKHKKTFELSSAKHYTERVAGCVSK